MSVTTAAVAAEQHPMSKQRKLRSKLSFDAEEETEALGDVAAAAPPPPPPAASKKESSSSKDKPKKSSLLSFGDDEEPLSTSSKSKKKDRSSSGKPSKFARGPTPPAAAAADASATAHKPPAGVWCDTHAELVVSALHEEQQCHATQPRPYLTACSRRHL